MSESYWNIESNEGKIVCPYCGNEYEVEGIGYTYIGGEVAECFEDEFEQTFTCDECGKKFTMTPSMTWNYRTETIDGEMTEDEHDEMLEES